MAKLHFISDMSKQIVLFPQKIDEKIAENDPVRVLDSLIESIDLSCFYKLYHESGRSPYHPRVMLKAVLYAYMNNIYSCRKIEKSLCRDVHFMWLTGNAYPDYDTINRFRNRVKKEINQIFTQIVLLLVEKGMVSLDVEYVDGTKIESKANKYTFVWKGAVEKNRVKLQAKIKALLSQIDEVIAQDQHQTDDTAAFTVEQLGEWASELRTSLSQQPEAKTKEEKKARKQKEKQLKELEQHKEKLAEYDEHLATMGERRSYSKTDKDATFMRMKEDAMNNGQTKPGYNLQIGTENQFITDFSLYPYPNDTFTLIPFAKSYFERYGRFPSEEVADSGYGSEENYRFMEEQGIEAFVKYNLFHKEQHKAFKNDLFRQENMPYDKEGDYFICPMGQHMARVGDKTSKTISGYQSRLQIYEAQNCKGCLLRSQCTKKKEGNRQIEVNHLLREYKRRARERLTSEKGLKHRSKRPIEPEAVFGQMKNDMHYKRFRHFGKDKVTMDFAFFAIAFNIKKLAYKQLKHAV